VVTRHLDREYGAETRAARRYDRTEHGRPYDDPLLFSYGSARDSVVADRDEAWRSPVPRP